MPFVVAAIPAFAHVARMRQVVGAALFVCVMHVSGNAFADPETISESEEWKAHERKARPSVFQTVIFDNLLGVSTSTSGVHLLAPFSLALPKGRSPDVYFRADVQFRVLDFLTIGVKAFASSEQDFNAFSSYSQPSYTTRNAYYVLARLGGIVRISDRVAFWPSVAAGPTFDSSAATLTTETGLLVEGELAVAYSLTRNVFFAGGPGGRGRAGEVDSGLGFGFNVRLGLTF